MITVVYGLCDPECRSIFYVGLTQRDWRTRLSDHCSNPASAAHGRIKEIRARGGRPICIVFGRFYMLEEARVFERDLISLIDGPLVNREPRYVFSEGRVVNTTNIGPRVRSLTNDVTYHPFDDGWNTIETTLGGDLVDRETRRRVRRLRERGEED